MIDLQQKAIDTYKEEGTFLILAGPGTGKTHTISQRIKAIINNGTPQERILCLTFSDAAAKEMKNKLLKAINAEKTDVNIFTYHSFCLDIIQNNPQEFEINENIKIMTQSTARVLIKQCIDELNVQYYRTEKNDPYYYIDEIFKQIEEIKRYRIKKEKFFENIEKNPNWMPELKKLIIEIEEKENKGKEAPQYKKNEKISLEKKINQMGELWKIYELYQEKMHKRNYIDFNDMILTVLNNSKTLYKEANKFDYILVDEYQDTNPVQNEIIFKLAQAQERKNIFVVGDDDQIIYTFQGARLNTIKNFLDNFPDTKVICLKNNWRSTQKILDISRKVIKKDKKRLEELSEYKKYNIDKELIAQDKTIENGEIDYLIFPTKEKEAVYIVNKIKELINSSRCPKKDDKQDLSQIAIIAQTNMQLKEFAKLLHIYGIECELKNGENIFNIQASAVLFMYMQLLSNHILHNDKFLKILLMKPFNINPYDYEIIYNYRSADRSSIEDIKKDKTKYFKKFKEPEKVNDFINTFFYLQKFVNDNNTYDSILEIGRKTGIFDYYINECKYNRIENISALKKLIEEAENFSEIEKPEGASFLYFLNYLERVLDDNIEINIDKDESVTNNAVQLTTYYSSKGLEYEYVFMPQLTNKNFESSSKSVKPIIPLDNRDDISLETNNGTDYTQKDNKTIKIEMFSRVIFVGITRAKHTLFLSYNEEQKPTELISEIKDENDNSLFHREENSYNDNNTYLTAFGKMLTSTKAYDCEKDFCSLVDRYVKENPFSVSSVNEYINCPRKFLYNHILKFSSKTANKDNLHYGTAVHSAYEEAVKYIIENKDKSECCPSEAMFIKYFEDKLKSLSLSDFNVKNNLIERGRKALKAVYPQLKNVSLFLKDSLAEYEINFKLGEENFKGKIDRIDRNTEDLTCSIIDYKTGNKKTIKPDSDYYNQMAIYKYAINNNGLIINENENKKYKVKDTKFIFIEDKNPYVPVEDLTDDDTKRVVNLFLNAIADIKSYKFEPSNKDEACKYCEFKNSYCNLEVM